ncbi:MAG TPA: YraN family protein [Acidimicrobiales bacterium]|nr:YraN family protein [Acidimicrobiales bacterium]
MTRARQVLGAEGENLSAAWYEAQGYGVLARNWHCREGELDLVVRRGGTIVFCEVKTRSSLAFGSPLEAVTPVKQRRIRRLAAAWLRETDTHASEVRFDVAAVLNGTVEVVQNAF